jgi:predicted DCC family thiol-disulfide oxidoreductase YuxK
MTRRANLRTNGEFSYRSDPSVPRFPDDRPIIIFDGMCVLCSGFARFVLRNDSAGQFRLLAAQTPIGTALYRHYRLDPVNYETYILLENGRVWFRSEAAIRVFRRLGLPWSLASAARLVPRVVRDWLYDIVARHRLRWFGARATCFLPDPSRADRFIG